VFWRCGVCPPRRGNPISAQGNALGDEVNEHSSSPERAAQSKGCFVLSGLGPLVDNHLPRALPWAALLRPFRGKIRNAQHQNLRFGLACRWCCRQLNPAQIPSSLFDNLAVGSSGPRFAPRGSECPRTELGPKRRNGDPCAGVRFAHNGSRFLVTPRRRKRRKRRSWGKKRLDDTQCPHRDRRGAAGQISIVALLSRMPAPAAANTA